ncbi:DUF3857 domain-containing protein [Coprobacter sp.]
MIRKILLFIILPYLPFLVCSQEICSREVIPDSLWEDAHSIVLDYAVTFKETNNKEGEWNVKKTILILNDEGCDASNFVCYTDLFRDLVRFQGKIYDDKGKLMLKIKRGDLKVSELFDGLASDDMSFFYECPQKRCPFTVEYEWTIKSRRGWLSYPLFCPIEFWNQSLKQASYTLDLPESKLIHVKPMHFSGVYSENSIGGRVVREWVSAPMRAYEREPFGPTLHELLPLIYIEPENFIYDKYSGSQRTWENLGLWLNELQENRCELSDDQKSKVRELTKNLESDKEKIKRLYEYLGETTRYVSIQLGVGGLQPMPAREVGQVGFGDCKALTNYMKAMLQSIDIPSIYTVISTKYPRFYQDYPSVQQMNHVILCIPQREDSLWLECTNPKIPFGYVHTGIAGHDAFLIKPEGSCIVRLPCYKDSLHIQSNVVSVDLKDSPNTTAVVRYKSFAEQYENESYLLYKDRKALFDIFRRKVDLPQVEVSEVQLQEYRTELPFLLGTYSISGMYGAKVGSRMFVPLNPFRNISFTSFDEARKYDINIREGYVDTDTIVLHLPQEYQLESIPDTEFVQSRFGSFFSEIKKESDSLTIVQRFYLKKDVYPAASQKELIDFLRLVKKAYNGKLVLKKNNPD